MKPLFFCLALALAGPAAATSPDLAVLAPLYDDSGGEPERELSDYLKALSPEEQAHVMAQAARLMGRRLREGDHRGIQEVAEQLFKVDADNGYALYFSGESMRKRGQKAIAEGLLKRYLSVEKRLPVIETKTGPEIDRCYATAGGYCQQRTGYICHLLANDSYRKGIKGNDRAELETASGYAMCAVENYPPAGFSGPGQLLPTSELISRLNDALSAD